MKFMTKSNQIRAVTVRELTRHVAEIFDYVEGGEPVLLIRHGRPIATIQPLEQFVVRRALEERGLVQTQTAPQVPGEQTEPPPDLTDVQWAALEGVANREHSDDTIRRTGFDVQAVGAAKGWLEVYGFIERKPPLGFGYQPTIKGLQALDIRSEANDGGAVS